MNERIRKLAEQAGATLEKGYIELSDGQFMLSDNVDLDKSNMNLEKFAELIVRECMDICYRTDTEYEGHKVKSTVIASKVAEHFGVEE